MTTAQLSFDFDVAVVVAPQPAAKGKRRAPKLEVAEQEAERLRLAAYWQAEDEEEDVEARAYWSVGMVTSLPLWCEVQDSSQKYTQMLPGVIESIDGDLASVRIYASPEYGYWLENYPIHRKLAINVRLRELGKYGLSEGLQRVVDGGLIETGDEKLASEVRAHHRNATSNFAHECEMGMVAA